MDSRLLTTLNDQARNTRNPVVWARAVCRAASHFARQGRTDDALESIKVVRAQFKTELPHEVASWLMLAEGVLHYFRAETQKSYDRIRRAYGLAVALQTVSALPSCAAWMAHIEFNDSKYEQMALHLQETFALATPSDHQAIARASLVLAMAYHLANKYPLARPWYEQARQHAAAEGDEATISAMLHDVAAYRAANVRLHDTFGEDYGKEASRASMEAASSINFDAAIGHKGLNFLTLMLNGLILTICKRFSEALNTFDHIEESEIPPRLKPTIHADKAWCLANIGSLKEAWQLAMSTASNIGDVTDDDDVAYIYSRLSQTAVLCNEQTYAASFRSEANHALERHRSFQSELLARIENIEKVRKNPA